MFSSRCLGVDQSRKHRATFQQRLRRPDTFRYFSPVIIFLYLYSLLTFFTGTFPDCIWLNVFLGWMATSRCHHRWRGSVDSGGEVEIFFEMVETFSSGITCYVSATMRWRRRRWWCTTPPTTAWCLAALSGEASMGPSSPAGRTSSHLPAGSSHWLQRRLFHRPVELIPPSVEMRRRWWWWRRRWSWLWWWLWSPGGFPLTWKSCGNEPCQLLRGGGLGGDPRWMESSIAPTEGGGRGDAGEEGGGEGGRGGGRVGAAGGLKRGENLCSHVQPHRAKGAPGHRPGQHLPTRDPEYY